MSEQVLLHTSDGVEIAGDFYEAETERALLLLHMMPATKESWYTFAAESVRQSFSALAIDFRGHGASRGGPDGYKDFSDHEHQASIYDVVAGVDFLRARGYQYIDIVGASIGANLAIQYASEHPEVMKIALLSPGLDYRGIVTESYIQKITENQEVYFVGDEQDMRSSGQSTAEMVRVLYDEKRGAKEIEIFQGSGHGTTMFEVQPDLANRILLWLCVK